MDTRRRMIMGSSGSGEGPKYIDNYLTIEALEDGLTASLSTNACEYCVDGDGNWITLAADTTTQSINAGQTLSFRGELTPSTNVFVDGIGTFTINKKCNLLGNCMSMLFGDNAADNLSLDDKNYAFCDLFSECTTIINVSSDFLPATTLADYCYCSMFYDCTSLQTAPELPATTLATGCYELMFYGCTSLTTAPAELPATTLVEHCYASMFWDCKSLQTAPELPATTLITACYDSMFYGCTGLTTAPELPATTLAEWCYCSMFYGCTSLTTAPELLATRLEAYCYYSMFEGCSKLNYIKMLATDISATNCLSDWVSGVASTGTFVKHSNMTSLPTGTSGIPEGWTVVDDGEENVNLITFTVSGTEYQAEEGMTWEQFINSEYNTGGFYIVVVGNGVWIDKGTQWDDVQIYDDYSLGTSTSPSDIIINGHSYYVAGGGMGD